MTFDQRLTATIAQLVVLAALVGLFRSGRHRLCYSFTGYALAIVTLGPLQTWVPGFNTWAFWTLKETVYGALKLGIAIELTVRIVRWFPGAKAATEWWVLGVLLSTCAGLVLQPFCPNWPAQFVGEYMARLAIGTLWLMVATAVAIGHYRLPTHPFHMGLIVGFSCYQFAFGALLRLVQILGWDQGYLYGTALNPAAYVGFALWLAWVSWRPDGEATENYESVVRVIREREVVA